MTRQLIVTQGNHTDHSHHVQFDRPGWDQFGEELKQIVTVAGAKLGPVCSVDTSSLRIVLKKPLLDILTDVDMLQCYQNRLVSQ